MTIIKKIINAPWQLYHHYQWVKHTERCRVILSALYRDIDTFHLSQHHRKQENITSNQFIYGEMIYASFTELLSIAQPKANEIFYDLGCGGGKAVFTTALLYPDIIARGVEYLPPLFNLCQRLQSSLQQKNVEFIAGDLLNINFSTANIIYLNVTCFDDDHWSSICNKLELLPLNARVIITTKQLTSKNFTLIHQGSHLMSWGMNTVNIYQKIN